MLLNTVLSQIRMVMVEPSHPGNVGAAARAMKTMGLQKLYLVNPRIEGVVNHPEAIALASGATDLLESACVVNTLEQALAEVSYAVALSARVRDTEITPSRISLPEAIDHALTMLEVGSSAPVSLQQPVPFAFVFGPERTGLSNQQVSLCHQLCFIESNPIYSSMNVAQAVQIVSYSLRLAVLAWSEKQQIMPSPNTIEALHPSKMTANSAEMEGLLSHWEQALIALDYLDPDNPRRLMARLRQLFMRNTLGRDEVDLLRGICAAILKLTTASNK
jgi:tRNA/rRNA methyltransferase